MIVIFKVIVNYDIIYDIIFVGQKYDIGQKYDNIRPNPNHQCGRGPMPAPPPLTPPALPP